MRQRILMTAVLALSLAACGGDGGDGDTTAAETASPAAAGEPTTDDAPEPAPPDEPAGSVAATITIDGTTWEVTEVLDCTVGNEGAPGDRQFVGTTADGKGTMNASHFDGEAFAGLNGVDFELDADDGTVATTTWSSSYAGPDGQFDITLRDDGAEGVAEVGSVGPEGSDGTATATWSFTC